MATYTIDEKIVGRALSALARASDELGRASLVIHQEANGKRPQGRTETTMHDIGAAMNTMAVICRDIEIALCDAARASAGLPAVVRA